MLDPQLAEECRLKLLGESFKEKDLRGALPYPPDSRGGGVLLSIGWYVIIGDVVLGNYSYNNRGAICCCFNCAGCIIMEGVYGRQNCVRFKWFMGTRLKGKMAYGGPVKKHHCLRRPPFKGKLAPALFHRGSRKVICQIASSMPSAGTCLVAAFGARPTSGHVCVFCCVCIDVVRFTFRLITRNPHHVAV